MHFNYTPIVLSRPLENKTLHRKGNALFRVGAATMQGWRGSMEDTHCISLSLPKHPNTGFFSVYDGHGGTVTSEYLCKYFHLEIDSLKNIHKKTDITNVAIEMDKKVMSSRNTFRDGSTAVFAIIDQHKGQYLITLGNIGDSRAILIKGGKRGITLTKDHVPTNKRERFRIVRAGGIVKDGRVRGELAVSRSFGDTALKLPFKAPPEMRMVIPIPDYKVLTVSHNDILLLTCDGIYEKETTESVAKFISDQLRYTDDLAMICSRLLDFILIHGSTDNMTTILIQFKDGTSYHKEDIEYIPGPYYEGQQYRTFRKAYELDAKKAGYSISQARSMFESRVRDEKYLSSSNKPRNTVIRRNSESDVSFTVKDKLVSDSDSEDNNKPTENSKGAKIPTRRKSAAFLREKNTETTILLKKIPIENNNNNNNKPNTLTQPSQINHSDEQLFKGINENILTKRIKSSDSIPSSTNKPQEHYSHKRPHQHKTHDLIMMSRVDDVHFNRKTKKRHKPETPNLEDGTKGRIFKSVKLPFSEVDFPSSESLEDIIPVGISRKSESGVISDINSDNDSDHFHKLSNGKSHYHLNKHFKKKKIKKLSDSSPVAEMNRSIEPIELKRTETTGITKRESEKVRRPRALSVDADGNIKNQKKTSKSLSLKSKKNAADSTMDFEKCSSDPDDHSEPPSSPDENMTHKKHTSKFHKLLKWHPHPHKKEKSELNDTFDKDLSNTEQIRPKHIYNNNSEDPQSPSSQRYHIINGPSSPKAPIDQEVSEKRRDSGEKKDKNHQRRHSQGSETLKKPSHPSRTVVTHSETGNNETDIERGRHSELRMASRTHSHGNRHRHGNHSVHEGDSLMAVEVKNSPDNRSVDQQVQSENLQSLCKL